MQLLTQKCAKKCAKYDKLYIFEEHLPRQIHICKNISKFFKTKFIFKENLKFAHFLCKISSQKVCNLLPFVQGFPKAIKSRNPIGSTGCPTKHEFY